jgi:hypothetical protein
MRFGSLSALLALAIQFTLLFGHFHRNEMVWQSGAASPSSLAAQDRLAAFDAPAGPLKPVGAAFDSCALCAVINLLGTMLPPAAPAAEAPSAVRGLQLSTGVELVVAPPPHLLFRARAPPLA